MKRFLAVAALAVGLAMPAWGQDFDTGVAAAQYSLGRMYTFGGLWNYSFHPRSAR